VVQGLRDHAGALIAVVIVCLAMVALTAVGDCPNSACESFGLIPVLAAVITSLQVGWTSAHDSRNRSLLAVALAAVLTLVALLVMFVIPEGSPSNEAVLSLLFLSVVGLPACLTLTLVAELARRGARAV
jgi:peptidoglycan/LPS O-acetylase OafA/YrhL